MTWELFAQMVGFIWNFPTQARELLEEALEKHPDFAKVNRGFQRKLYSLFFSVIGSCG